MPQVASVRRFPGGGVRVRLDDGRTFRVPESAWRHLGLVAPGPVEPDAVRYLERENALARMRERALRLLAVRPRASSELRERLCRYGPPELVAQVVEELQRRGLVDDLRFAVEWVRERRAARGLGAQRLRYELLRKGVDRETVEHALREGGDDEEAVAVALARDRLGRSPGLPQEVAFRRLAGYLARRGFSPAVVSRALWAVGLQRKGGPQDPEGAA
jgi:regulatory protein